MREQPGKKWAEDLTDTLAESIQRVPSHPSGCWAPLASSRMTVRGTGGRHSGLLAGVRVVKLGPLQRPTPVLWLRPRCRAVWEFYKKLNVSLKYVPLVPPAGTDALGHTETCV